MLEKVTGLVWEEDLGRSEVNRKWRRRKDIETVLTEDEAPSSGEFEPVQGSAELRNKDSLEASSNKHSVAEKRK